MLASLICFLTPRRIVCMIHGYPITEWLSNTSSKIEYIVNYSSSGMYHRKEPSRCFSCCNMVMMDSVFISYQILQQPRYPVFYVFTILFYSFLKFSLNLGEHQAFSLVTTFVLHHFFHSAIQTYQSTLLEYKTCINLHSEYLQPKESFRSLPT